MTLRGLLLVAISLSVVSACGQESTGIGDWEPDVIARYPHDPSAFTQGLTLHDGRLFESTGQYGRSSVREVNIDSGRVERIVSNPRTYFGEGIAIMGDRVYQLTWLSGTGFVYDLESFEQLGSFEYEGEGWGLTHDGTHLIMSDGSSRLRFLDPADFSVVRTVDVVDGERPVTRLNELEFIRGEIWSNIWYDDRIARISPDSGEVIGWVDLTTLYPRSLRLADDVLNGIAYDADTGRLLVTGKNWPTLFELQPIR